MSGGGRGRVRTFDRELRKEGGEWKLICGRGRKIIREDWMLTCSINRGID